MKLALLAQGNGQSLCCEMQQQTEQTSHPYAHACVWASKRKKKICHYGEVKRSLFLQMFLLPAFVLQKINSCTSNTMSP